MRPVVAGLAKTYAGRVDIRVLDTSRPDATVSTLSERFGVEYVPTFVLLDSKGKQQGGVVVGAVAEGVLTSRLDSLRGPRSRPLVDAVATRTLRRVPSVGLFARRRLFRHVAGKFGARPARSGGSQAIRSTDTGTR